MFSEVYFELLDAGFLNPKSPNCIWISDMLWIRQEEIPRTYYHKEMKYVMPFARTGSGDIYGWFLKDPDLELIVICNHDDGESRFYAPNFISAIFRRIIEFSSEYGFCMDDEKCEEASDWPITESHLKNMMKKYLDIFGSYFHPTWNEEIRCLISSSFKEYHEITGQTHPVLLFESEAKEKIKNLIPFENFDKSFNWMEWL